MNKHLWNHFINIVKQEVVPALGCTEPISVALAAAIAAKKLTANIEKISVYVSPNLMKNGMGVGVPGTGMVGLPIAAAIGAVAGNADAGLEVLKDVTDADLIQAKSLLDCVSVNVADVSQPLYAKVIISSQQQYISVTIADAHTHVLRIEENGITTYIAPQQQAVDSSQAKFPSGADSQDIYDFAMHVPLADIAFIEQAKLLNQDLSQEGLAGDYGLKIGKTFQRNLSRGLLSLDLLTSVIMRTAAASDARMDGAMKPAMSNSGSGNQGISATMPVVATAEFLHAGDEQVIRGLMLANLMAIYIKSQQQKLSALCAATTAAMGAAAAITYLLGGDFKQMGYAVSSMIGDVSGIICDGAKPSCAMKVSSSAGAAVKAALMALDGHYVSGDEGIVAHKLEHSIANLCQLANGAMMQTDTQILDIMVKKTAVS